MYKTIVLKYEGNNFSIIIDKNGEPWFRGNNIATILKLRYSSYIAKKGFPLNECKKITTKYDHLKYCLTYVNEEGLLRLIFKSKSDTKNKFREFIFGKVIPGLKITGVTNVTNVTSFIKENYPLIRLNTDSKCITIPLTVKKYNHFFIFIKTASNKLTPKCRESHHYLRSIGWKVMVSSNHLTIVMGIIKYMNQVENSCQMCKKYYTNRKDLEWHLASIDHYHRFNGKTKEKNYNNQKHKII